MPNFAGWSVVIVTQGDRPTSLSRAVASALGQGAAPEVVVVGNGWEPTALPPGVVTVTVGSNKGAPGGRNRGLAAARGELLFFLDDDAWLPSADTLDRIAAAFAAAPALGVVQTRIASPEGVTARRWVPRLRDKNPARSSAVFSVLEGSVAVRRDVLDASRGWAGRFRYAHEGVELAWRAWDAGYRVEYRGDLLAHHPLTPRSRHRNHLFHDARNRVWLARRNLPAVLAPFYVLNWGLVTLVRALPVPREFGPWLRGCAAGMRSDAGRRRPISWRTVWVMTRHGRPPVV